MAQSFIEKDQQKLYNAIDNLVKASKNENQETVNKFFDNNNNLGGLQTVEIEDDYVSISREKWSNNQ